LKAIDYVAPKTSPRPCGALAVKGDRARCLAGGTDVPRPGPRGPARHRPVRGHQAHSEVNELSYDSQRGLRLGAAVPCCVVYEHREITKAYPGLIDAVSLIGGIQIQGRAASAATCATPRPPPTPFPRLIAWRQSARLPGRRQREVPVENFCVGPGRTALRPGEFLVSLRLPPPKPYSGASYLRFIPRNEMDIAVVGAGVKRRVGFQQVALHRRSCGVGRGRADAAAGSGSRGRARQHRSRCCRD